MESRLHLFLKEGLVRLHGSLANLFFPEMCTLCDEAQPVSGSSLCAECSKSLKPVSPPVCYRCGLPIPGLGDLQDGLCGQCLVAPPKLFRVRYGVHYRGALRHGLIRFKFYGALHTVPALAQIAVEVFRKHFQSHEFDMIVPVPIHRSRLVHRGFNQAIILGERLSAGTGIPLYRTALRKVKDTVPQVGLPRAERLLNVRGSFAVSRREVVKDRRILLIDDVATTGSTINEAAKVLMKGKAQRVDALVLALRLSSDVHAEEAPEHPLTSGP